MNEETSQFLDDAAGEKMDRLDEKTRKDIQNRTADLIAKIRENAYKVGWAAGFQAGVKLAGREESRN